MDETRAFIEQLLRTGLMLTDLLSELLEQLPDDAFPGQEPGVVLIDMLIGTSRPVADAAGEQAVRAATALLGAVGDRTLSDLRVALDLASQS